MSPRLNSLTNLTTKCSFWGRPKISLFRCVSHDISDHEMQFLRLHCIVTGKSANCRFGPLETFPMVHWTCTLLVVKSRNYKNNNPIWPLKINNKPCKRGKYYAPNDALCQRHPIIKFFFFLLLLSNTVVCGFVFVPWSSFSSIAAISSSSDWALASKSTTTVEAEAGMSGWPTWSPRELPDAWSAGWNFILAILIVFCRAILSTGGGDGTYKNDAD